MVVPVHFGRIPLEIYIVRLPLEMFFRDVPPLGFRIWDRESRGVDVVGLYHDATESLR
jgi:hypothetical protein